MTGYSAHARFYQSIAWPRPVAVSAQKAGEQGNTRQRGRGGGQLRVQVTRDTGMQFHRLLRKLRRVEAK
jgi:hypothetical protein